MKDDIYYNVKDHQEKIIGIIRTRYASNTYFAYYEGQKLSCTMGSWEAARRVFHKVHGYNPHMIEENESIPPYEPYVRE